MLVLRLVCVCVLVLSVSRVCLRRGDCWQCVCLQCAYGVPVLCFGVCALVLSVSRVCLGRGDCWPCVCPHVCPDCVQWLSYVFLSVSRVCLGRGGCWQCVCPQLSPECVYFEPGRVSFFLAALGVNYMPSLLARRALGGVVSFCGFVRGSLGTLDAHSCCASRVLSLGEPMGTATLDPDLLGHMDLTPQQHRLASWK